MKTNFYTSEDIRLERQKLEAELASYKSFIEQDIKDIKEELNPIGSAISVASNAFQNANAHSLSQIGVNMVVDRLASKIIPGGRILSGIVLPFIAKNLVGNLIENRGEEMLDKAKNWVKHLFKKSKDESDSSETGTTEEIQAK